LLGTTSFFGRSSTHATNPLSSPNEVKEILELLEAEGWNLARTKGSHRQLKHQRRPGTVTVSGNWVSMYRRVPSIAFLKQAGLKRERQ
jgi:predicted RNA binding protein YcfA (HicA-like mRNA interferase family)